MGLRNSLIPIAIVGFALIVLGVWYVGTSRTDRSTVISDTAPAKAAIERARAEIRALTQRVAQSEANAARERGLRQQAEAEAARYQGLLTEERSRRSRLAPVRSLDEAMTELKRMGY